MLRPCCGAGRPHARSAPPPLAHPHHAPAGSLSPPQSRGPQAPSCIDDGVDFRAVHLRNAERAGERTSARATRTHSSMGPRPTRTPSCVVVLALAVAFSSTAPRHRSGGLSQRAAPGQEVVRKRDGANVRSGAAMRSVGTCAATGPDIMLLLALLQAWGAIAIGAGGAGVVHNMTAPTALDLLLLLAAAPCRMARHVIGARQAGSSSSRLHARDGGAAITEAVE